MVHDKKIIITPKRVGDMLGVRIFSEKDGSTEGAVSSKAAEGSPRISLVILSTSSSKNNGLLLFDFARLLKNTLQEKIAIATQYLVPKQAKEHGLDISKLTLQILS